MFDKNSQIFCYNEKINEKYNVIQLLAVQEKLMSYSSMQSCYFSYQNFNHSGLAI